MNTGIPIPAKIQLPRSNLILFPGFSFSEYKHPTLFEFEYFNDFSRLALAIIHRLSGFGLVMLLKIDDWRYSTALQHQLWKW